MMVNGVLMVFFLLVPVSIIYGLISYLIYKFSRGGVVDEEDRLGFGAALRAMYQAESRVELQEKEHEALFSYKKYKDVIRSAAEEKRNLGFLDAAKRRIAQVRKRWRLSFYLFYGMRIFTNIGSLYALNHRGGAEFLLLLGIEGLTIVSALIVYHCAFRKEGTRLLLVILCVVLIYIPGVCVSAGSLLSQHVFQLMGVKSVMLEVVLPGLFVLSIVTYYWVMGLLLFRANREMARIRKLEHVKLLLQM